MEPWSRAKLAAAAGGLVVLVLLLVVLTILAAWMGLGAVWPLESLAAAAPPTPGNGSWDQTLWWQRHLAAAGNETAEEEDP
jgi:hypothetical protein